MDFDKSIGVWDFDDATPLDELAYHLYCLDRKETFEMWEIRDNGGFNRICTLCWFITYHKDYLNFYKKAQYKLRRFKVDKLIKIIKNV